MINNKTYTSKDFGDALKELIQIEELTYGQLALKIESSATYINDLLKRKLMPPRNDRIEKFAKALRIKPEYFYEYRLRRLISLLSDNREYLDLFIKEIELSQKKRKAKKARVRAKKMAEAKEVAK